MVLLQFPKDICLPVMSSLLIQEIAGSTRRFRHAFGRHRNLSLLHCMDAVDGMNERELFDYIS